LLPIPNSNSTNSAGAYGHGAGTPAELCDWWIKYLCPPRGTVLDPFVGSGTVAICALKLGKRAIGIDKDKDFANIAYARCGILEYKPPPQSIIQQFGKPLAASPNKFGEKLSE
jgi:DNA modification methylase